jgi:hypothetical protein
MTVTKKNPYKLLRVLGSNSKTRNYIASKNKRNKPKIWIFLSMKCSEESE